MLSISAPTVDWRRQSCQHQPAAGADLGLADHHAVAWGVLAVGPGVAAVRRPWRARFEPGCNRPDGCWPVEGNRGAIGRSESPILSADRPRKLSAEASTHMFDLATQAVNEFFGVRCAIVRGYKPIPTSAYRIRTSRNDRNRMATRSSTRLSAVTFGPPRFEPPAPMTEMAVHSRNCLRPSWERPPWSCQYERNGYRGRRQ